MPLRTHIGRERLRLGRLGGCVKPASCRAFPAAGRPAHAWCECHRRHTRFGPWLWRRAWQVGGACAVDCVGRVYVPCMAACLHAAVRVAVWQGGGCWVCRCGVAACPTVRCVWPSTGTWWTRGHTHRSLCVRTPTLHAANSAGKTKNKQAVFRTPSGAPPICLVARVAVLHAVVAAWGWSPWSPWHGVRGVCQSLACRSW